MREHRRGPIGEGRQTHPRLCDSPYGIMEYGWRQVRLWGICGLVLLRPSSSQFIRSGDKPVKIAAVQSPHSVDAKSVL